MKKLLGILALTSTMIVTDADAAECNVDFGFDQLSVMTQAYDYGKAFGYEYSLAAIVWQESSAGRRPVGGIDNAKRLGYQYMTYGPFHTLLKTAIKREKCKNISCESAVVGKLMTDFDYAAKNAVAELAFWERVRKGNWLKIWGSYYAGYTDNGSMEYALKIRDKVRYLKNCVEFD